MSSALRAVIKFPSDPLKLSRLQTVHDFASRLMRAEVSTTSQIKSTET